ncbi:hypothetical protein GQ44DRAFT_777191 [Phaeosphaeriaceae sp. PMI808]|nr:hypothetical protein GQ44DRAFT_777191 [Phaeosphaeriaceae sp. PMI808]
MASDVALAYPSRPNEFIRITDDKSFIKFGYYGSEPTKDHVGFDVGYSTRFIELCHRLTPYSVKCHLEWSMSCNWKGLISVCGSPEKADQEVRWRKKKNRQNITSFKISTTALRWTTLDLTTTTKIDVLTSDAYNESVVFIKATELIRALGLNGNIDKGAEYGAKDEWFALEWIPLDMIVSVTRF